MITTIGLSQKFLKKEPFSGSYGGMRFLFKAAGDSIEVCVYPEPFCIEMTPEDQIIKREFPSSPEGIEEATDWLNQTYEADQKRWSEADSSKMTCILKK